MSGINKVILIGNLGQDPELNHTSNGSPVCNISIATSRKWKDKDGNQKEDTQWHKVTVWGQQAENCKQYLSKGKQVYIEGRLQTRTWEDKEGNKRTTTEVVAETVQFLGGKPDGGGRGASNSRGRDDGPPPADDGDIPF